MATSPNFHALVIGASGIIGWSVVNQLLAPYPSPSPFCKVTALVNRPLRLEDSFWPEEAQGRPELALASGVNLLCGDEAVEQGLREKVGDIGSVSHVHYFAFKEDVDSEKEVALNVGMMRSVVRAIKSLSTNFKFIVYPGGTRGYGIYLPNGIFTPPLTESMASTLPESYTKTVAYPHYRAMLTSESVDQPWSWSEVVPDAIIGFTPNASGFSLAGHWAVYLYLWKLVHGEGADVPFPGTQQGYESLYSETSAGLLARVAIYASLHPDTFREKLFNVADSSTPDSMTVRWPQIASWFGLNGTAPVQEKQIPSEFIKKHEARLKEQGAKGVNIWNAGQLDAYGYWLTFDRQLSLERLRGAGFKEERGPEKGWWEAFEMFRRAGMIN